MDVVFTTPYYPPHTGGVEFHVQNLAKRIAKRHKVRVISSTGIDSEVEVLKVKCIEIPYSPIPIEFPDLDADVYHSHIPSPFFAREIAKRNKRPHVVTYHNDIEIPNRFNGIRIPFRNSIEFIGKKITREILENSDLIIATTYSYANTSEILSDFDYVVIPNGIDLKSFKPGIPAGDRERIVLYIGRISEYKGLNLLIDAMDGIDAKLIVIGDGEDRKRFQRLAEKKCIEAEFLGRVSEGEKIKWLRKARVLVLPSRSRLEAFGIVLLEAMACSTPVIASNTPGVKEIALKGGFVFRDRDELRDLLLRILESDNLATRLGRKGRCAVKIYDWDRIAEKIEKLYYQLT